MVDGKFADEAVPALRAINCRLLDDYIADCQGGIDRWNKVIEKAGIDFKITQPHKGFNRRIGEFKGHRISPDGRSAERGRMGRARGQLAAQRRDMAFIGSLMKPCTTTRPVRELDRAAAGGHQQPAG